MAKKRVEVPRKLAAELLAANEHTCCICREPRKHVTVHHIDGDPSNNDRENLAVVCHDCHSRVTGDEGLGRRYSEEEVTLYKERWESACSEEGVDQDEPSHTEYELTSIGPDEHKSYFYDLEAGDFLTASIKSSRPVDVFLCPESAYKRWARTGGDIRSSLDANSAIYEADIEGEIEREGTFVVVVVNTHEEKRAKVSVDVAIWPPGSGDDGEE